MSSASEPAVSVSGPWKGRSGRIYLPFPSEKSRSGGMASVRPVAPAGAPVGASSVPPGTRVALKLARQDDPLAMESMAREAETFEALCRAPGQSPCPRLYDVVGSPPAGLVMEWCPTDLERWWEENWSQPRSFVALCEAFADICRRVREYETVLEMALGRRVIHADIKPRNVLRAEDGRWLLTDFGASKSRAVEEASWQATQMILGTENFIAPEALFNARKPHPTAMDTWSLGASFFAMLRMRAHLKAGQRLPANGTHAMLFRSHRMALVADLHERKPTLFINRDLDPSAFSSPDRLPERDRKSVEEALAGLFDGNHHGAEVAMAGEILRLLDHALHVDPAKRYLDPLEMAGDFESVAQRYRELEQRAQGGAPAMVVGAGVHAAAPAATPPAAPPAVHEPSGGFKAVAAKPQPAKTEPEALKTDLGRADTRPEPARPEPARPEPIRPEPIRPEPIRPEPKAQRAGLPTWVWVALLMIVVGQFVQFLLVGALYLRTWSLPDEMEASRDALTAATEAAYAAQVAASQASAAQASAAQASAAAPAQAEPSPGEPATAPSAAEPSAEPNAAAAPSPTASPTAGAPTAVAVSSPEPATTTTGAKKTNRTTVALTSSNPGLVLVSGAQAYLMGSTGRIPVGTVQPGTYELFVQVQTGGEFKSQGHFEVVPGQRVLFKCTAGACRRE